MRRPVVDKEVGAADIFLTLVGELNSDDEHPLAVLKFDAGGDVFDRLNVDDLDGDEFILSGALASSGLCAVDGESVEAKRCVGDPPNASVGEHLKEVPFLIEEFNGLTDLNGAVGFAARASAEPFILKDGGFALDRDTTSAEPIEFDGPDRLLNAVLNGVFKAGEEASENLCGGVFEEDSREREGFGGEPPNFARSPRRLGRGAGFKRVRSKSDFDGVCVEF